MTIGKLIGAIGITAGLAKGFRMVKDSVHRAFGRIDTMEQFGRVMEVMLKDTDKVNEVLEDTREIVTGTAYTLDGAAASVQNFVTRGVEVDKATTYIEAWGDAVAFYGDGSQEQFDNVSDALSQMLTRGKVTMDQMNRLTHAGIPAVELYADAVGMSSDDVQEALSAGEISAEEFVDTVSEAMQKGGDEFPKIAGAAKEAGATWGSVFANMRTHVATGMENIIESIDEMLEQNGLPDMREMVKRFGEGFRDTLTNIGDSIPAVVDHIKGVYDTLEPWIPLIKRVLTAVAGFTVAFATFNTLKNVIMGVRGAMLAFNAAMMANPIGLIIGLLAGLATVFYHLWETNEEFREFFIEAWNHIKETFISVWESISEFIVPIVHEIVEFVMETWGILVEFWQEHGQMILEAAQNVWTVISTIIEVAMNIILSIMQAVWPVIQSIISTTWEMIVGVIQGAIDVILGIIQFFSALFTGDWSALWDAVKRILSGALSIIQSVISGAFNIIRTIVSSVMSGIQSVISGAWNAISSIVSTVVNGIRSTISNIFNSLRGIVSGAFNRVRTAVSDGIGKALDVVVKIKDKFFEAGKNIVTSIADGIKGAVGKVTGAIKGVADKVRSFLPFSPAKEGPLKDIDKLDFISTIGGSIRKAVPAVQKDMQKLVALPDVEPINGIGSQIKGIHSQVSSQLDVNHTNQHDNRMITLLEKIANSEQVIVLDTGELVGGTYPEFDRVGSNQMELTDRWGR